METRFAVTKLAFALLGTSLFFGVASGDENEEFFESRVRPLLVRRCYECHRRQAEGGLRVDSRDGLLHGGESGSAIVPGNPQQSLLWKAVSGSHESLEMPPDEPLKSGEIKNLEKWIADGAFWPESWPASRATPDEYGISPAERQFWSFQPISRPHPPHSEAAIDPHPIDAFVSAERRKHELPAVGPADPVELARRISYSLIGLPPSPDLIDEFVQTAGSDRSTAVAALIELLLGSKQYGERWAQHWLDLVRYADTAGDAADYPIPEAYKYRNYVIDSFNADKPYDVFIREQIAGDLLPSSSEQLAWQQTIATGYIAISRRIGVSPQNLRHITIEDTLDNVGKTFLGLSVGCARCHDHKFDPIPTADYYALYGIFDSTVYPHPGAEHEPYRRDFVFRLGDDEAERVLAPYAATLEPWRQKERAAFKRYKDFQIKPINIPGYNRDVAWREVLELREQVRKIAETFPEVDIAYAASEGDANDVHIQEQGNPKQPGKLVSRGFLQILGGQILPEETQQSGRRQLADWIADERNPLTARVIVNRIWHHHFGRGLVSTPSDFGVRGSRPSHPELLDFLARYLIDNNWSIKSLHRLILSSKTYQLASETHAAGQTADPENVYLWRANRRQLDAEQLRDSILTFSDKLDLSTGQSHDVGHRLTFFFRQHEPFIGDFESDRRSIYLFRQRLRKNPFLELFDGPDGNLHFGKRRPTITSLQSLYFMNSPFVERQSGFIADRLLDLDDDPVNRIVWAYRQIFGRRPTSGELERTTEYINRVIDHQKQTKRIAWSSTIRAMLSSNEFIFVE